MSGSLHAVWIDHTSSELFPVIFIMPKTPIKRTPKTAAIVLGVKNDLKEINFFIIEVFGKYHIGFLKIQFI